MPDVKEILEKALEFYEDHDWIQGQRYRHRNSAIQSMPFPDLLTGACLEGACFLQAGFSPATAWRLEWGDELEWGGRDALVVLRDAAYDLFPERFPGGLPAPVHKFNDHELTTREDAILALKHAIAKADG